MPINEIQKAPSVIHLAKQVGRTPNETAKNVIQLKNNRPPAITPSLRVYVEKLLGGTSYKFLIGQARNIKNEKIKNAVLEVLPLMLEFSEQREIKWFRKSDKYFFRIAKGIDVPIQPLGIGMIDDEVTVLFSPLWKYAALNQNQFRIAITLIQKGYIEQKEGDIDRFLWLETHASDKISGRELSVRDHSTADTLTELEYFGLVDNLVKATAIVAKTWSPKPRKESGDTSPTLF